MDELGAIIHDADIRKVFEVLVGAVGTLAMAVALVSKTHLKTLNKTIDSQANHIKTAEDKVEASDETIQRLVERTENLEKAFSINAACPVEGCPNKQLLKAAEVIASSRHDLRI